VSQIKSPFPGSPIPVVAERTGSNGFSERDGFAIFRSPRHLRAEASIDTTDPHKLDLGGAGIERTPVSSLKFIMAHRFDNSRSRSYAGQALMLK